MTTSPLLRPVLSEVLKKKSFLNLKDKITVDNLLSHQNNSLSKQLKKFRAN